MKKALMMAFVACSMLATLGACNKDSVKDTKWEGTWTKSETVFGQTLVAVVDVRADFEKTSGTLKVDPHAYVNSLDVSATYGLKKENFSFDYTYEDGKGVMTVDSPNGKVDCPFVVAGENMTLTITMDNAALDNIVVVLKKM